MDIHGLQKLTLLDYPGKIACTVFLGGCNLRCPFCHNSELLEASAPALMDDKALLRFLETRTGLLEGVCISGGEPLLRRDLPELLRAIKALGFLIKLDTNGTRPQALQALVEEGLVDYVAMDIKNSPARYPQTTGLSHLDLEPIRASVAYLLTQPVAYEFRTTVVAELHDAQSFHDIGLWLRGAQRYVLQSFEDRESVLCQGLHAPQPSDLEQYAAILRPYIPQVGIRGISA